MATALLAAACSAPGAPNRNAEVDTTNPSGHVEVSSPDTGYVGTLLNDLPRPALRLRTTMGRRFDLQARPATEATVVFFGYTHCPDVCPTTMADLAVAYRQLAPSARRDVTVVFVTEDPRRDIPDLLRRWLDGFDPRFVGLMGGGQRTRTVLQQLYAPVSRINPDPSPAIEHPAGHHHGDQTDGTHSEGAGGNGHHDSHGGGGELGDDYGVDHTGTVYVFGPGGQTVLY
ncbi:MAG: SCO family protein, partial [Actinomycetota bacterium]|nr:SCO family protein [Actinomycetota bacterium]